MTIHSKTSFLSLLLHFVLLLSPLKAKEFSVELTSQNFEERTAGKTVFIKFFSPSCAHCQALVKSWDRMASEWVGHAQGLVGAVDCTKDMKFCDELKITGLPTLLYGEPTLGGVLLLEYRGDKTYEDFSRFANETLILSVCSPVNLDACLDDAVKNKMMYFLSLGTWELDAIIKEQRNAIQATKDAFENQVDAMQSTYNEVATHHELFKSQSLAKIKMLKEILASRKTQ